MTVNVGVLFADRPNLREGLRCECGLSNRQRLLFANVKQTMQHGGRSIVRILEQESSLYRYLQEIVPGLEGSEFLEAGIVPGSLHKRDGKTLRHENFCDLSYQTDSTDLLIHNDIMEHISDYESALREAHRVLKPGGMMIFTCPFFLMPRTIVRARVGADGEVVHLKPPEIHGDGLRPEGILAYYNYGWDLVDKIRAAGFSEVVVAVEYDVFRGLTSCNYPETESGDELTRSGNMLPLLIRAKA